MTLDDLRSKLAEWAELPGATPVILAVDGEGNRYSPLDGCGPGMYLAESTWRGEYYPTEEHRKVMIDPDAYSETPDGAVPAVFLWPTS